jgi:hypothetical protein
VPTFIPGGGSAQYKCEDNTFVPGGATTRYKCETFVPVGGGGTGREGGLVPVGEGFRSVKSNWD